MTDLSTVRLAVKEIAWHAGTLVTLIEDLPEAHLWATICDHPNPIGTLARHITGNLNHYFGAGIMNNGYVRQRDVEFTERGLAKQQVIDELRAAVNVVEQSVAAVDIEKLDRPYNSLGGEAYD